MAKGFKWELLTWWGIIGGAITLFVAISATLRLADWARWIVENWKELTHAFWAWAFGWLGIHLPPEWTPTLSFLLFGSLLAIGQAVKFTTTVTNKPTADKYSEISFRLPSRRFLLCLALSPMIGFVAFKISLPVMELLPPFEMNNTARVIILIGIFTPSIAVTTLFAKQRLHAALSASFMYIFFIIIAFLQLVYMQEGGELSAFSALAISWILPVILLSVAPARAVSRRLIFLAMGLLLLIALNELSKLGLDVTAPKLQG